MEEEKKGGFIAFLVSPSNKLKTAKAPHRIRESRKKRERERERVRGNTNIQKGKGSVHYIDQ